MFIVPDQLEKNILSLYGDKGREWLQDLPSLLIQYEQLFEISIQPCYQDLSFHYVAPVVMKNAHQAVLKCSPPGTINKSEIAALKYFNGVGCVKLYHADAQANVMLLEKADPGFMLETINDLDQAAKIAVNVMRLMHKPIKDMQAFDSLHDLFEGFIHLRQQFQGKTGPFSEYLVDRAERVSRELLDSMSHMVLLHGDLHYANILSSKEHDWVAIDPKGVIGEPEFEIPLPRLGESMNQLAIKDNIDRFIAVSGYDRQRILGWLFAKSMLAAWWSFEDHGKIWKSFIQCAEVIEKLK